MTPELRIKIAVIALSCVLVLLWVWTLITRRRRKPAPIAEKSSPLLEQTMLDMGTGLAEGMGEPEALAKMAVLFAQHAKATLMTVTWRNTKPTAKELPILRAYEEALGLPSPELATDYPSPPLAPAGAALPGMVNNLAISLERQHQQASASGPPHGPATSPVPPSEPFARAPLERCPECKSASKGRVPGQQCLHPWHDTPKVPRPMRSIETTLRTLREEYPTPQELLNKQLRSWIALLHGLRQKNLNSGRTFFDADQEKALTRLQGWLGYQHSSSESELTPPAGGGDGWHRGTVRVSYPDFENRGLPPDTEIGFRHLIAEGNGQEEISSRRHAIYEGEGRWEVIPGGCALWHEKGGGVRAWSRRD